MANLPETPGIFPPVYQLDEEDEVLATDDDSPSNRPLRQLTERTRYLRDRLAAIATYDTVAAGEGSYVQLDAPEEADGTDYEVYVTPLGDASDFGAWHVTKNALFFRVYNSGGAGCELRVTVVYRPLEA